MQIKNPEEEVFGGRGKSNGYRVNPTSALLRDIPEVVVDPTGEDILRLILPLVLVVNLKPPLVA